MRPLLDAVSPPSRRSAAEIERDSVRDTPVWIPVGRERLFGMLTAPGGASRGIGVVLMSAGGAGGSLDRNRLNVLLARRIAAAGFHVLRFDLRGLGESTGRDDVYLTLARLYTEDLLAAIAELRRRGLDEVIVVGRCFGARTAFAAADRIRGLRGLALISTPLQPWITDVRMREVMLAPHPRVLCGLLDRRRRRRHLRGIYYWLKAWAERPWPLDRSGDGAGRVDALLQRQLHKLIQAGIPVLFVHGTGDPDYRQFSRAREGAFGRLLGKAGDLARVATLDGYLHHLWTISIQQGAIACIQDWIERVASPAPERPRTARARPGGDGEPGMRRDREGEV